MNDSHHPFSPSAAEHTAALSRYYAWHARVYDATRWSFLFGRTALLEAVAQQPEPPRQILEVGCGTGSNLLRLQRRFPQAAITGLDLSDAMLARARRKLATHADRSTRIKLMQRRYDQPLQPAQPFDLIVFSYCLSMINPGWRQAVTVARQDLSPDGRLAVVDFHDTRHSGFQRWMGCNHVRMEGHLLPYLHVNYRPLMENLRPAYGGVWRYFWFIGQKSVG